MENVLAWIHGKEFLLLVLVLIVGMTLYGHNRGLVRMLISAASLLISLFIVNMVLPFVETQVQDNAQLQEYVQNWSVRLFEDQLNTTEDSFLFQMLGLDSLAENVGSYLAGFAIRIICFIVLFLIVNLIMKMLAHVLNVVTNVPIICGMNQLGGAFVGCAEGVFYVWILMLVIMFTPTVSWSSEALRQIADSSLLTLIYENNLIIRFLAGIFLGGAG